MTPETWLVLWLIHLLVVFIIAAIITPSSKE